MNSSYLLLKDLRLHYLRWQGSQPGRSAVLLHGLASNARIWEWVAPHLAQAGYTVYALDARGHGLTDSPDGSYGFETFRRDLDEFLAACELENPLLVGHSWGASVALDYAAQAPRTPRYPCGIFLVDGGVIQMDALPGATWETTSQRLAPPRLAGTPLGDFLRRMDGWRDAWKPEDPGADPVPIILANFDIDENERIYPRLTFERHMQIVRAMWEFQTYQAYETVRCPVRLVLAQPAAVNTEQEQMYLDARQRSAAVLQGRYPGLQVQWMADSIHDLPLQRPASLAAEINRFGRLC